MNGCRNTILRPLALVAALIGLAGVGAAQTVAPMATPVPQPGLVIHQAYGPRGLVPLVVAGREVTMPATRRGRAGFSRHSGLQLSIDAWWPGQYGYRPVMITLRSQKPTVVEQRITVRFSAGDYVPPRGDAINVEQSYTFPAGAKSITDKMIVPRLQDWQIVSWEVLVDGRRDEFLTVDDVYFGMTGGNQATIGVMGLGLDANQQVAVNNVIQTIPNGAGGSLRSVKPPDLPDDWREYSSIDVFLMPAERVDDLAEQHPAKLTALLRWVRAGGNLWLVQAGNSWRAMPTAEKALGFAEEAPVSNDLVADRALLERGWRFVDVGERAIEASQGALLLSGFEVGRKSQLQQFVGSMIQQWTKTPHARRFVVRGHGLGAIVAFRRDLAMGSNPNTPEPYSTFSQSLIGPRLTWASRHGNQPDSSNEDFNNLLIPGVGMAPVGQFQILVTLFAIAIGPLNYWLLKRANKLPMLLATVPIAALVTTLLLFTYGLLVDGFGVRARARTLTLLDQRDGEAVSWGRLSYYAGIAPRDGLEVPRDQLMYPIMPTWQARRYGGRASSAPRHLVWTEEQQLKRGWLASRTPTQYQAVISRPSNKRLDLRVTGDGLRIVNRLGVDITHLAVEDHDGRFYWCEDLADGQGRVVPAADRNKLASGIRQLFTDNIPESPGGDEIRYGGMYGYELSENLMEGRLAAINDPAITSWGRGKYFAFTRHAVELDLGLDEIAEESSFHVVEGSW
jgi:hypothetical protein